LHEKSNAGSLLALRAHDVGGAHGNFKLLGDAVEKLRAEVEVVKGTVEDVKKQFSEFERVVKERFDSLAVEVGKCVESVDRGDGVQKQRNRSSDAIISRIVKAVLQHQETMKEVRNKDEGRRREYAGVPHGTTTRTTSLFVERERSGHRRENDDGVRQSWKRIKRIPSLESCSSAPMA